MINEGYPPQPTPPGYTPQPTGYPPQSGYPPPQQGYPPPQQGYPPPQQGYPPPQQGYPPPQQQPAFQNTQTSNTTVVIQQQPQQIVVKGRQPWSTDLCSCFEDMNLCLIGFFCPLFLPCVVSCKAGECCCVGTLFPVALRASIRERHNIQGDIVSDCCALSWCPMCAFCQMGREVDIQRL